MSNVKPRAFGLLFIPVLLTTVVSCTSGHEATRVGTSADPTPTFAVRKYADVPYCTGPDASARRRLDIYRPEGASGAPVLMWVHGGAWQIGSKFFMRHIGKTFARQGIVTVCINYRLSPGVRHPEHVRDVALAFDWVKRNIDRYGGDPEDVFIAGHSAGGHLVALLALNERYLAELGHTPDEIAGVIAISGVYQVGGTSFIFRGFDADEETLIDASPQFHVYEQQPPFLIIYAQNDLPLLDIQAISLARELEKYESPVRLLRVEDRGHLTIFMDVGERDDPTTEAMIEFIGECSGPLRPDAREGRNVLGQPHFP